MQNIHIISDFSSDSYKIGLLKKELYSLNKELILNDITHGINLGNLLETSFVFNQVFDLTDKNQIFLLLVGNAKKFITFQVHENWIIAPDNGLLTLCFPEFHLYPCYQSENGELMETISTIILNKNLKKFTEFKILVQKQPNLNEHILIGENIYIDAHGNSYYNINKKLFYEFVSGNFYKVFIQHVPNILFENVNQSILDVNVGEACLLFNKKGWLKLCIRQNNASKLFRIKKGSTIIIQKT